MYTDLGDGESEQMTSCFYYILLNLCVKQSIITIANGGNIIVRHPDRSGSPSSSSYAAALSLQLGSSVHKSASVYF